jgi:EmrB/QacA subfamily drug resistance transporter
MEATMTDSGPQTEKLPILGLMAMGLAVLVIANDFTALSVALPAIETDFSADVTEVQWVINGYALVFGVLIVTGGRLADMFGRRNVFFIGAAIFAVFSLIGGLAPDIWVLLISRGIMGIGGALMWPAILGMTYAILPKSRSGLAGGLILGAAGFGNAIGPLIGGTLTDTLGWRWIFFLNLPIAAFAVLVTWRVVAADAATTTDRRIDYAGIVTLSLGLLALLLALDEGATRGWGDPAIIGLFVFAAIALAAFAVIEGRAGAKALIPADVLENRAFLSACVATLMMSAIFFASLLYLPQFMSKQLGFSAVGAGAGLLPMMGVFALTSFVAGPLYERAGPKAIVSAGAACLMVGIFILSRLDEATGYPGLVAGMVVLGIGVGLFYSSITTAAVTALEASRASLAGGIVYMFQIAGGSIGLGLNTAIVVTAPSLTAGIRTAFLVDAFLALIGLVIAVLLVGGKVDRKALAELRHHHRAHG